MKILYSIKNNIDAEIQLYRFLKLKDPKDEIKIFYFGYSSYFDSDINLNYFYNQNNLSLKKIMSNTEIIFLYDYVKKYNPDVIIFDGEYILPYIGNELNIPTISYSCNDLFDFLMHENSFFKNDKENLFDNIKINCTLNLMPITSELMFSNKTRYTICTPLTFKGNKTKENKIHISCSNKRLVNNLNYFDYKHVNDQEYFNSIASSDYFVCEFLYTFIIDAFYNNKFIYCYKSLKDKYAVLYNFLEKNNFAKLYNGEDSLIKKNILDFDIKKKNILDYIKEI